MGTEKQKSRPDNEEAKKLLGMAHFSPQLNDFTSMKLKGGHGVWDWGWFFISSCFSNCVINPILHEYGARRGSSAQFPLICKPSDATVSSSPPLIRNTK